MAIDNKLTSSAKVLLAAIFLLAALVRLVDLTDAPLELHPTRQMRAALIARAFYYPTNPEIPTEKVVFATEQIKQVGVIEPSILEFLTAQLYRLTGAESPWLGRLISISFWLAGGWAVFALSREMGNLSGGILALVYYLFLPFGLLFSRTLLPDPMMIATAVLGLWGLYRWANTRQIGWAFFTCLLTGFSILSKSVAGIFLILPFATFLLSRISLKEALKNKQVWIIFALAAAPSAAYYFWGLVLDGRLATQFSGRFFPELWKDLLLYKSWGKRIMIEFGLPAFLLAMAGIMLARDKADRRLLFFWWVGYFVYGIIFAYHIMTHDYYHLPMVPLTAVSIGAAVSGLIEIANKKGWKKQALVIIVVTGVVFTAWGTITSVQFVRQTDYRLIEQSLTTLGEQLDALPEGRTVALSEDYETSLKYYTFRNFGHWPHLGDLNYYELQGAGEQELETLWEKNTVGASYFLVTDEKELIRQPLLADQLSAFPTLLMTNSYTLYDLRQ
ncbi:MAG: glycosyltransferase family 39 protein [bacterium]